MIGLCHCLTSLVVWYVPTLYLTPEGANSVCIALENYSITNSLCRSSLGYIPDTEISVFGDGECLLRLASFRRCLKRAPGTVCLAGIAYSGHMNKSQISEHMT